MTAAENLVDFPECIAVVFLSKHVLFEIGMFVVI